MVLGHFFVFVFSNNDLFDTIEYTIVLNFLIEQYYLFSGGVGEWNSGKEC